MNKSQKAILIFGTMRFNPGLQLSFGRHHADK